MTVVLEALSNLVGIGLGVWMFVYLRREWRLWLAERRPKFTDKDFDTIDRYLQASYDASMRLRDQIAEHHGVHIDDEASWPGIVEDLRQGKGWILVGVDSDTSERLHIHVRIQEGILHLECE